MELFRPSDPGQCTQFYEITLSLLALASLIFGIYLTASQIISPRFAKITGGMIMLFSLPAIVLANAVTESSPKDPCNLLNALVTNIFLFGVGVYLPAERQQRPVEAPNPAQRV